MGFVYTRFTPTLLFFIPTLLLPHLHLLPKGNLLQSHYWNILDITNL